MLSGVAYCLKQRLGHYTSPDNTRRIILYFIPIHSASSAFALPKLAMLTANNKMTTASSISREVNIAKNI